MTRIEAIGRTYKFVVLTILFLLVSGCTKLFFYPLKEHVRSPADLGYNYSDVSLTATDGTKLHAWLIDAKATKKGFILFLHGNAENISTHVNSVLWLVDQGYSVLALDYRGYGLSEGSPDVPAVYDDIHAAYEWVDKLRLENHSTLPLYIFAQSLGASLSLKYLDLFPGSRSS